eukprot:TRINITY_DN19006_c0_g1_i1.p1 TRINITY_DN19006_c0_g1~~TRINITY_DN19006_c0_g1_i1.p1  ORF type:complete len:433 (+),score=122.17 TRINITY_DN19006_c0_g1_i1:59-1300(+)
MGARPCKENKSAVRRQMQLCILRHGSGLCLMPDNLEVYQSADDDVGRLVQWSLLQPGSSYAEKWEVRFVFTHVSGPNGGSSFGLGFGTQEAKLEEIDIMADYNLVVMDAFDGEVNCMGVEEQGRVRLEEPGQQVPQEEESITAMYDSKQGIVRFSVDSPRLAYSDASGTGKSHAVTEVKLKQKGLELYPTAIFARQKSKVRIEMKEAKMQLPTPTCPRLTKLDHSELLDSEEGYPSGVVTFRVDGRSLKADRFLLSARSEYFERMLKSGMAEGSSEEVSIPRASYAAFEAVLRFVYSAGHCGEAIFDQADPLEVLHLASEFMLDDLLRLCEWRLLKSLKDHSAEKALEMFASVALVRVKVPLLSQTCIERLRGRLHEFAGSSESFSKLCKQQDVVGELLLALDEPNSKRRCMR